MRDLGSDDIPERRTVIAALLVSGGVIVFLYAIHQVLLPFVLAGAIAFIFTPVVEWLAHHARLPRLAAALIVFFMLLGVGGLVGYLVLPQLMEQLIQVSGRLQTVIGSVLEHVIGKEPITLMGQQVTAAQIGEKLSNDLRDYLQSGSRVFALASWTFVGIFGFFLTCSLVAYFLASGHLVARGFLWVFPPRWRPRTARILLRLHPILRRYFTGIAIVVAYACVASYIGLGLILHLRHAAFLALATGFLEVIPIVGPAISAVGAGLVAVVQAKSIWGIFAYAIYATILRLSIDQLVGPIVLGKAARVHPTLVIFCFLAGGFLFGIPGVLLAVPVALTVKVILATIYGSPLVGPAKKVSTSASKAR